MVADNQGVKGLWHVYIVECNSGEFYTGVTHDLADCVRKHNSGKGCEFTKCRTPIRLLYSEECNSKKEALKREIIVREWSRKKKEEMAS